MAGSGGSSPERTWSGLPDDNLADVYLRLSSLRDQLRFSSVCTSWRAVAWWHPAPLIPVLLPWTEDNHRKRGRRTRAQDLEGGRALRVPLPWFARGKRLVGSYTGGWIAAMSDDIDHVMIVNLSSGAQVKLSTRQRTVACTCKVEARSDHPACTGIVKIIFSDYPDSSGCILAAITGMFKLAVCRLGSPDNGWITPSEGKTPKGCQRDIDKDLTDIGFCGGKLYGLVRHSWEVFQFDIGVNPVDGALAVTSIPFTYIERPSVYKSAVSCHERYIFELRGKLAMALEASSEPEHNEEARFFMVFEMDATPWGYMWTEVTTLGDNALFLGSTCSKAVRVPEDQCGGGLEKNHIYYSKQHRNKPTSHALTTRLGLGCLDVYCWENQAVHRWGNQTLDRSGKRPAVHHREVMGLHRWANQSARSLRGPVVLHREVQAWRRSLGAMITSRGYGYVDDDDGRNGCIWLFLPRDL